MGIKQILLHLDHSSGCENRLNTALELVKRFDAQLRGLFVVPDYIYPAYMEAQLSIDLMADISEKAVARARDKLLSYQQQAEKAGVPMQAGVVEGLITPILREHSKYADLMLLGQDQPDDPDNASYAIADDMLLEGACASMVIPHSGKVSPPGKRILLAWNASREAARAVRAAMPFLTRADEVVVLSSEPDSASGDTAQPHAEEIAKYLKSHGVKSVGSGFGDPDMSPATAIMSHAADMKADMIVMGAYGHMRLREIILGGVTRELVKKAPLPLLMAH